MRRIVGLAVVLSAGAASAATVDPSVMDAIKKIKPADYPSANSVLITNDQSVVYQPDGQLAVTAHVVELVLTQAGRESASSTAVDFSRDGEKVEILVAQVIKADGTVVAVPASAIQETEQSGGGEGAPNIYDPDGRSTKVTFSGLAVGDAVEFTYKLTRTTPIRAGFFDDIFEFQGGDPMLEASYTVDGPASLPLTAQIYHEDRGAKIESEQSKVGDRIHYKWSVRNVPQIIPELGMDAMTELPTLVIDTDPSWEHFSAWWAGVTAPQMEATADIKAKVAELTKDAKTDDEKIKAMYDFVSSDIRYRGLGVGPHTGFTPRKAEETFTSRWGVCRDVAILLATMLRADGFEAYPVLTNAGEPMLPKIAYDGFNHAIVAMPGKSGGWTFLDPTAKNNTDLLPAMEHEQHALVCTSKGETLGLTPPIDPSANLGHATATSTLNADGSLDSKIKLQTKGLFDLLVRSYAAMTPKDQQREIVEQFIHHELPDAQLISYDISNAMFLWSPMEIDFEIKVPRAAVPTGNYQLLRSVVTSGALGIVEAAGPVLLSLPSRKYTLDAHTTFEWDEDESIALPAGIKVLALPNDTQGGNAVSSMVASCKQADASSIACHRSVQLKSRFIDPNQYTELRSVAASLARVAHQPIVLGGATPQTPGGAK